ncbi:MAG: DsbA family oxidoreductase [Pseudomonadota bacterium]
MVPLDIISDPICPWCYIGKARLETALTGREDLFDLRWRTFQLNPEMPAEGMDRKSYLDAKFGADAAKRFYTRIAQEAEAAGLSVRFDLINRTPSTIDAHRLIRWSRTDGAQDRVVNALFRKYFEEGEDISSHAVLVDAAREAGMDPALVQRLLAGEADRDDVREEDKLSREMGVTGVPTFIIDGRYVLQGAQESATWVRVIDELSAIAQ